MRFTQLLILIVLCGMTLLTSAQTGPNYQATRTALAEMTSGTHVQATRNFLTPAEYLLTVTAQGVDATATANAVSTRVVVPTAAAQSISDADYDLTSTAIANADNPTGVGDESSLLIALLLFGGLLAGLAILGGLFFMMSKGEQGRQI